MRKPKNPEAQPVQKKTFEIKLVPKEIKKALNGEKSSNPEKTEWLNSDSRKNNDWIDLDLYQYSSGEFFVKFPKHDESHRVLQDPKNGFFCIDKKGLFLPIHLEIEPIEMIFDPKDSDKKEFMHYSGFAACNKETLEQYEALSTKPNSLSQSEKREVNENPFHDTIGLDRTPSAHLSQKNKEELTNRTSQLVGKNSHSH